VLLWNEDLPGYTPSFIEVKERVLADYKETEKRRLFIERGQSLKAQLQAAAKTPTGFADKAAAEKLEVKSYTNFTIRTAAQDFPRNALEALVIMDQGQVSDMIATEEGKGLLVYAQEKKLPDLTPGSARYVQTQAQLSALLASNGENAILGELVEAELKKTSTAATP
jgi:peptidyl-prolyl cis-trans isomerase D